MAARSICHRFVRLYDPSMPDKPTEESYAPLSILRINARSNIPCRMAEMKTADAFFPSPQQVAGTDIATLRTAGLSGRKAEYGENPLPFRFIIYIDVRWLTGTQSRIWRPTSPTVASPPRNFLQRKMRNYIPCSLRFAGSVG